MVRGTKGSSHITDLVEVHEFYATGLYGFRDYRILPQMFTATIRHLTHL